MSLSKDLVILAKRQYPRWINGGEFERFAMDLGYKGSNASRRCRELATGKDSRGLPIPIELDRQKEGGSVEYRWKLTDEVIGAETKWEHEEMTTVKANGKMYKVKAPNQLTLI